MLGKIEILELTTAQLCEPSISVVVSLLALESLSESQVEELERNVRHLQLFDYHPAASHIVDGLARLDLYQSLD